MDILFLILQYWGWYRNKQSTGVKNIPGSIEGFLDYLVEENKKGGGL